MNRTLAVLLLAMSGPAFGGDAERTDHFENRVRPLLVGRCVSCHGPDKVKGGLRLDSAEAARRGGDGGPAWVPGEPDRSSIILAVRGTRPDHPGDKMPPKDPLADRDIEALARWVRDGAVWPEPRASAEGRRGDAWSDPQNPVRRAFGGERLGLWSLRKPAVTEVPAVTGPPVGGWAANPIDRFIRAKLRAGGLRPSPEADRRTLIRRLTFDLHGLPPTPDEVAAFLADARPDAYERLADRLLASPRYGERWARHWLDVVRYADTDGFERDEFRPQMWRYRDYAIRSFNEDKPYDRFVAEQLAGDELGPKGVRTAADADRWIATGFLRLGPYDSTAGLFGEAERGRDQLLTDLTNTTASAFLGLTYSCCQCHDHKYDPLTQADHFRLRAFFAAVEPKDRVVDLPAERKRIESHNAALDREAGEKHDRRAGLLRTPKAVVAAWRQAFLAAGDAKLIATYPAALDGKQKKKREEVLKSLEVSDETALRLAPEADRQKYRTLGAEVDELGKRRLPFTTAAGMTDKGRAAPATKLLHQGDYKQPRDEVAPGIPSAFDPNPLAIPAAPTETTGRRAALARWVASGDNPLTARVMVNRIWHHHFGRGLVATPNDFGFSGAKPTHPELLDWLAARFVESGWSVKAMHRLVVTSAAYRQSSAAPADAKADPDNLLLGRQTPRRLDAESLRDALLAVSGRALAEAGGPARWPEVAEDVLLSSPAILEARNGKADGRLQDYYADPVEKADVRSVYLIQKRSVPYPFLQPFDLPDPSAACGCRSSTTVAPQALALLNSPTAARLAKAFAARIASTGADADARVEAGFALALCRQPTEAERKLARRLIAEHSLEAFARALLNLNEFLYID